MEVVALCPLPVAGVLWRTERGWSLTVVCKATFELAPGELRLRREQLPLRRHERHHDDEPVCSVREPSDIVPFKPKIDVLVVGHAYAATKTSQVVTARLEVNEVSKAVRVYGARAREADGARGPTASFRQVALRYERAAGGPGSDNPVGMPLDGVVEPDGSFALPNLEPADEQRATLAGFGPIAATWPSRRKKLGRHADELDVRSWWVEPFPADIDLSFFNAAPDDQQLETLRPGDTLRLQHLHPKHAALELTVPALSPHAYLQSVAGDDELLAMRCDTVWIDTDEEIVTLTWRGHVRLPDPEQTARCVVVVSNDGRTLSPAQLQRLLESADVGELDGPPSLGAAIGLAEPKGDGPVRGQLLEVRELEIATPPPVTLVSIDEVEGDAADEDDSEDAEEGDDVDDEGEAELHEGVDATARSVGEHTLAVEQPTSPPSVLTAGQVVMISSDQLESIPPSTDAELFGPKIVKLVWVDRARVRAIQSGWRELLVAESRPDGPNGPQRELRDVHHVLVSAYPASALDIEAAVAEAVGRAQEFQSPLILSSGNLRLTFDELAVLRATVTAAAPFASGQYELEQLLAAAKSLLNAPWLVTADGVAAELTLRIRETFSSATRGLPPAYLESQAQRIVVSERCFQRRELWGRRWIRAAFTPVHSRVAFATYLPDDVADFLPLFEQFFTRLIAQVDLREDQFETHPLALKVCALARVLDSPLAFSRS